MSTIITYDIPSKHSEFKQEMFKLGYKDFISDPTCKINLPNTTLYHASNSAKQAREYASSVCNRLGVKLQRCVATQWGPDWAAVCGDPL